MFKSLLHCTRLLGLLSLGAVLFTSPTMAKVPSNAELHQMIVGVMAKMETLQSENRTLKKQLASLNQGQTYASVSPTVIPASVHRESSPIKAVVRSMKWVPQVATNSAKVEVAKRSRDIYARISVAYSVPENVRADDQNGNGGVVSLSKDIGFEAAVGKRISDEWRTEIEVSARNYNPISATGTSGTVSRNSGEVSGDIDLYAAQLNAYYSLPMYQDFAPYIGAGIGVAYLKGNDLTTSSGNDSGFTNRQEAYSNHFWLPAGNVSAGLTVPLTPRWDVDFGYKFALFGDLSGTRGKNSANSSVLKIHNLNGGLRYRF
jgi:opacity protein-like surface antigen